MKFESNFRQRNANGNVDAGNVVHINLDYRGQLPLCLSEQWESLASIANQTLRIYPAND